MKAFSVGDMISTWVYARTPKTYFVVLNNGAKFDISLEGYVNFCVVIALPKSGNIDVGTHKWDHLSQQIV